MSELKRSHIIGGILAALLGTFMHFTYDMSGQNSVVGVFSAVNESTFEHLKLLFFPIMLFGLLTYFIYGERYKNHSAVTLIAVLKGMAATVISFYTYVGILGRNFLLFDILTFLLGMYTAFSFSYKSLKSGDKYNSNILRKVSVALIFLLIFAFGIFTFYPPQIGLFDDPTKITNCMYFPHDIF